MEAVYPGTLNGPRATRSTEVRTVFSSLSDVSCSQGVGAVGVIRFERDDPKPTEASNAAATRGVFILFLELERSAANHAADRRRLQVREAELTHPGTIF